MGAAIGGPIESVSMRGRLFPVAADADAERKLGGFENEVSPNGDGTARIIKTRVPWSISGLALEINEDRGDQQFLKEIADGNDFVTMTVTFASSHTYQGRGIIADEINFSSQNSTAEVTLSGPGEASKQ
jgi:hypothetical protein